MDDNKEFKRVMDKVKHLGNTRINLTFDSTTLDLFTVREMLERYDSLTIPFPSHEEIDRISESLHYHMQPGIPENIKQDARILQQRWVDFHNEFLAFIGLADR